MRNVLLDLCVWAVAVILLFGTWIWGANGFHDRVIAGLVVLVAIIIWNRRRLAKILPANRAAEADETSAAGETRKLKFDLVRLPRMGIWGLWILAIADGAGLFGKNPYLSYVFVGVAVISFGTMLTARLLGANKNNLERPRT